MHEARETILSQRRGEGTTKLKHNHKQHTHAGIAATRLTPREVLAAVELPSCPKPDSVDAPHAPMGEKTLENKHSATDPTSTVLLYE